MCGRYSIVHDLLGIQTFFGVDVIDGTPRDTQIARYNIAPTQENWVIFEDERDKKRHLAQFRWGLIPSWAKPEDVPAIGSRLVNARSETVLEKPSFKRAALSRRCLVPMTALYEWKSTRIGKKTVKVPQKIQPVEGGLLAVAGIYELWRSAKSSQQWITYSLLTQDANPFMREIHDRMPVFVPHRMWGDWLSCKTNDPRQTAELIHGVARSGAPALQACAVSTALNSPSHEGPHLWSPFEGPSSGDQGDDEQGRLF